MDKDKKKKIIVISAIILAVVIIAIICLVVFTGGDNNNNTDNTTSNNTIASTEETSTTEPETESLSDKETTTEQETTSEVETTTEEETTKKQSSKDYEIIWSNPYFYTKKFSDGSEKYYFTYREYLEFFGMETTAIGVVPPDEIPYLDYEPDYYINGETGDPYAETEKETTTQKHTEPATTPPESILDWIKSNYGERFTYDNRTYFYNKELNKFYCCDEVTTAHKMTSATTSEIVTVYKDLGECSVEYVGSILGCPGNYNGLWGVMGLGGADSLYDENYNYVTYEENTEKYLKKAGCEETNYWLSNWEFMTTEGIPVTVRGNGYIKVDVKYNDAEEKVTEYFTIEEYMAFISEYENRFYIGKETKSFSFNGGEYTSYTNRWVVITDTPIEE